MVASEYPLVASWDDCNVIKKELRFIERESPEEVEGMDEAARFEYAARRVEWDYEWEMFEEDITHVIDRIIHRYRRTHEGYWFARGSNLDWRGRGGHKYFHAEDGEKMLENLLPQTDCHITVWRMGPSSLRFRVCHHDCPTGSWFDVHHLTKREAEENFDLV